ncbi:hypothetical protein Lesp02_77280 [Lentzea sp. NBRC 105346]|uniref:hypothetical protein n=1 Tax=Lentzea sp. NBRC 105346 TaxID=3032205 RepID=UPI0024A139AB|nr:hypothetical protein [Lentzea sp. NBRC 105346]GLZ35541.1 hypothetical protein Lesp02_77280 [Lentzea sp. NBRC 105346]
MKFIKGSLLLVGAVLVLSACGTPKAAPTSTPKPAPTSSSSPASDSSAPKTPEKKPVDDKPKGARTVDVAMISSIDDGKVTWITGKIVSGGPDNGVVQPIEGTQHETAELAPDVKFYHPLECGEPKGVTLDAEGVGALACTRAEYLGMASHYGTKIVLNEQGEIVMLADRHHP